MIDAALVGSEAADLALAGRIATEWDDVGLAGAFLARRLVRGPASGGSVGAAGPDLGFEVDRVLPLASLVKLPLALAVLDAARAGELGPRGLAEVVVVDPDVATRGETGLGAFEHPCTVALGDLVTSALTVSDNAAADLLLDRVPPRRVTGALRRWGLPGIVCRHRLRDLHEAAARAAPDDRAALELAVRAATDGGGHAIGMLDVGEANVGSARAVADLLAGIWTDAVVTPEACARVRQALGRQLTSRRIAAELVSDAVHVSTKTGSFLNLRHDAAVVETDGAAFVVVALTESRVPLRSDPSADLAIGRAARLAVEHLRDRDPDPAGPTLL